MKTDFNYLDRLISYLRLRQIKKFIRINTRICDLGCGDGKLLRHLHEIFVFAYALGIDYKVEKQNLGRLHFLSGDISKIPVADQSFDTVLMLAVIEHLDRNSVRPILAEAHRILVKHGRLILTTPTPLSKPVLEFLAFRLGLISKIEIADHKHYYTIAEAEVIIRELGYDIEYADTFQYGFNSFIVAKKI